MAIPPDLQPGGTSWVLVALLMVTIFVLVIGTISFYGNFKTQPWYVSAVCIVGWFFPFGIILLLPLDLASTMCGDCDSTSRPFAYVSQSFLYVAWRTLYWTSFCLTWFTIPMTQAYVNAGDFTLARRMTSAARVNIRFYMIYVVIGMIGLLYLVFQRGYTQFHKIQSFVMAMANSWGLLLAIVFMGYGLVAIPHQLWSSGDTQRHLDNCYANAPRRKDNLMDKDLEFKNVAKVMYKISHAMTRDQHTHTLIKQMVARFPFVNHPDYADRDNSVNIPRTITEEYLVKLNEEMIKAARLRNRSVALWNNLLHEAFHLEDVIKNRHNVDRRFHSTLRPLGENKRWTDLVAQIEWWWAIRLSNIVYKALAIVFSVISICILWSELTFNVQHPIISLVSLTLKACGQNYAAIEIMSFFTLLYMCICVYTSLFKVRFFEFYLLIPKHHTDENSLLWFTGYMCKLMAPLCYNYINLTGEDMPNTSNSVFSKFMGRADLVPFLGTIFMDWFPVVILIPALSHLFAVRGWHLRLCGIKSLYVDNSGLDPEAGDGARQRQTPLTTDIMEGKDLIKSERLAAERLNNPSLDHQSQNLLGRVKQAYGAYSSKYGPSNVGTGQSRALTSSGRSERDRRLEAILSGRPMSPPSGTPSPPLPLSEDEGDSNLSHSQLESFSDAVKQRLRGLFGTKPTAPDAQRLEPPSPAAGGGRVFGRITTPPANRIPAGTGSQDDPVDHALRIRSDSPLSF